MRFLETKLDGCLTVEIEPHRDERGAFARLTCQQEFQRAGLPGNFVQSSISRNLKHGTTRGMHFQLPPSTEGKLVRCIRGKIYDVAVDIRDGSTTYLEYFGIELSDENLTGLYIPPGFAHGFQTLADNTDVLYEMTDFYQPELGCGFRWNDPAIGIDWPVPGGIMHDRDRNYPDFDPGRLPSFSGTSRDG